LSIVVEGANDPTVQFSTSGRTVAFTIPENTTRAIFANNADRIRLQTGTCANNIVLAATFSTATGLSLTPDAVPRTTLVVPPAAPQLLDARLGAVTASSFEIVLTGYATNRQLSSLDLTFAPQPGYRFPQTAFSFDLAGPSTVWFSSRASESSGGLFSITVSFAAATGGDTSLLEMIRSISARVTSAIGASSDVPIR
jgi:hypothetical protein